jgi:hypothetical protein
MLTGSWESRAPERPRLILREDLLYQLEREGAADEAQDVRGAYDYDGRLKVQGLASCGRIARGIYNVTVEDTYLALEPVEEPCEERRAILAGEYERDASLDALAGWWMPASTDNHQLHLSRGGLYSLYDAGSLDAGPIRSGTYTAADSVLNLVDVWGQTPCGEEPGTYEFELSGEQLRLKPAIDGCETRKEFFEGFDSWRPAEF